MNSANKKKEIPDFRKEDNVWVRTLEEKGTALLERYLRQTDQGNESERLDLVRDLQDQFEDELRITHTPNKTDFFVCQRKGLSTVRIRLSVVRRVEGYSNATCVPSLYGGFGHSARCHVNNIEYLFPVYRFAYQLQWLAKLTLWGNK